MGWPGNRDGWLGCMNKIPKDVYTVFESTKGTRWNPDFKESRRTDELFEIREISIEIIKLLI